MKPAFGVKTIKGVIVMTFLMATGYFLVRVLPYLAQYNAHCNSPDTECSIGKLALIVGGSIGGALFLRIAYAIIQQALIACFPVACGHRRYCFTGRSSKPLQEILLLVDNKIPTEEQLQEFKEKALLYLNDIKTRLEEIMATTTFQFIFSGSAVERFGITQVVMPEKETKFHFDALFTDLDVMFCSMADQASWSGLGNILIEPRFTEREEFTGYVNLKSLTPGHQGMCISPKVIREQVKEALNGTRVINFPGIPCCCGNIDHTERIKIVSKGPAMKLHVGGLLEADITLCIQCPEWPTMCDWASRPRYWPSEFEAQRIMSFGCHLVAKSAPKDKDQTSWRLSFSLAEVELSKLVPDTARKCFLALKIILKDHLQPVVPGITSYHMKTIFFNTLEKVPVGFWVENNVEECFLTLLAEVRDALISMNCPHHWFSFVNLFDIEANELQRLAKKVQRIMQHPAPFILDDGCCCLSPCCARVPHNNLTHRSSDEFRAEYDEVTLSAEGHVIADPGNHSHQLPVSQSPSSEDHLDSRSYSSGIHSQVATSAPQQLVVSLPPIQNASQEPNFSADESEAGSLGDALPLVVILPPVQNA
ncbi:uncharacterized protein [Montipora capricornis]|uniref:uncharacterized protein n=1 Tax=Montipora capricornis TaxID=246305 RepID=UPI0035F17465